MRGRSFSPVEVMFVPTNRCNLRCGHCLVHPRRDRLPAAAAIRFLQACAKAGMSRVSFTGGEPFLAHPFLCRVSRAAARQGLYFGRLMTNGAWHSSRTQLEAELRALYRAGYDGELCVSVDAFHRQDLRKVAAFIRAAVRIWHRPDVVSLVSVLGARERRTRERQAQLARLLRASLTRPGPSHALIRNDQIFIRIMPIDLAPVGPAARLRQPWNGRWFRDDYCRGPGHVLVVEPDGNVKPCCGYANDLPALTIGSIRTGAPRRMMRRAARDPVIAAIFELGLQPLRRALESSGWVFPGKTSSHCFFCRYLLSEVPRARLVRCVKSLYTAGLGTSMPPRQRLR